MLRLVVHELDSTDGLLELAPRARNGESLLGRDRDRVSLSSKGK
jgi:hypothetical protein